METSPQERRERILTLRQETGHVLIATERAQEEVDKRSAVLSVLSKHDAEAHLLRWEYNVIDDIDIDKMDALGRNGWDMVSAISYQTGYGIGGNTSLKVHFRYVFKRELAKLGEPTEAVKLAASALKDAEQELARLKERKLEIEAALSVL